MADSEFKYPDHYTCVFLSSTKKGKTENKVSIEAALSKKRQAMGKTAAHARHHFTAKNLTIQIRMKRMKRI